MSLKCDKYQIDTLMYDHLYLCNYVPKKGGSDELSYSILRFKNKQQVDLQAWIDCAISELRDVLDPSFIIVRALHSNETCATDSPLDMLANQLAEAFDCRYAPNLITKSRSTKSLKPLKRDERYDELDGVFAFHGEEDFSNNAFLIIDDVLTTGITLQCIAAAISRQEASIPIKWFTLARSQYPSPSNSSATLKGDKFVWSPEQKWIVAESDPVYNELRKLKQKILNDSWDDKE